MCHKQAVYGFKQKLQEKIFLKLFGLYVNDDFACYITSAAAIATADGATAANMLAVCCLTLTMIFGYLKKNKKKNSCFLVFVL